MSPSRRRLAPILALAITAILIIALIGASDDRPDAKPFVMPPPPPAAQPELPPAPQLDIQPTFAPPPAITKPVPAAAPPPKP
ncbi:MAG: hypothetical protein U0R19_25070 [Bryobacteraceae bacterium]